jgi:hypothetical protein
MPPKSQTTTKVTIPGAPNLLGTDNLDQAKILIGAVLAAGQDGCTCTACQLLKKFGGFMSKAVLEEVDSGEH